MHSWCGRKLKDHSGASGLGCFFTSLPVLCHITDAITLNDFRTAIHLIVFLLEGTVTCRDLLDGYDELDVVWGSYQGPDISGVGASALAVATHPELTV